MSDTNEQSTSRTTGSRLRQFLYGRTANTSLALAAIVLGVMSLAGRPDSNETVSIDLQELALIVENEVDHVTVQELADQIIKGETNYRLLDLRDAEAFATYRIPGAENVELTGLLDYPLLRNERIVLYSGGGIHSAQAWFLLKAKGYKATYMLLGGLNSWQDEVLFPVVAEDAPVERLNQFAELDAVARHFGGQARRGRAGAPSGSQTMDQQPGLTMPPIIAPTAPVIQSRKRTAREGC